jgi:hypothetical protein
VSETPDLPPLSLFDRRLTRRAVLRGVLRTAYLAFLAFVVLGVAFQVGGQVLMQAFDRDEQLERVGVVGFVVGHPSYRVASTYGGAREIESRLRTPTGAETTLSIGWLGRLGIPLEDSDPLDVLRERKPASRVAGARFLADLPHSTRVDVLLQLARPLPTSDAEQLAAGGQGPSVLYYESPWGIFESAMTERDVAARAAPRPVSWSPGTGWGGGLREFRTFRDWTRTLSSDDDDDLAMLGLPRSADLHELGEASRVQAVFVSGLPADALRRLVHDPAVLGFVPLDVRFDLVDAPAD